MTATECRCNADDANDAKMNATINRITRREWKKGESSGVSVPGCYNSPPLTRDLDPRS